MIMFLLRELEKCPRPLFSRKELLAISPSRFRELTRRKILVYHQPDAGENEILHRPRCQHGCGLTVMEINGGYEAVCLDHPEEDPISIEQDDLLRYEFGIEALLKEICVANGLAEKPQFVEKGCYFVEYGIYDGKSVGILFIFDLKLINLTKLKGLKALCQKDMLVVLTPATGMQDLNMVNAFLREKMVQASLLDTLNLKDFGLLLDSILSKLPVEATTKFLNEERQEAFLNGESYSFTEQQFKVVKCLYKEYLKGESWCQNRIVIKEALEKTHTDTDLHSVFKSRQQAWKNLFLRKHGMIRLNLPDPTN